MNYVIYIFAYFLILCSINVIGKFCWTKLLVRVHGYSVLLFLVAPDSDVPVLNDHAPRVLAVREVRDVRVLLDHDIEFGLLIESLWCHY